MGLPFLANWASGHRSFSLRPGLYVEGRTVLPNLLLHLLKTLEKYIYIYISSSDRFPLKPKGGKHLNKKKSKQMEVLVSFYDGWKDVALRWKIC